MSSALPAQQAIAPDAPRWRRLARALSPTLLTCGICLAFFSGPGHGLVFNFWLLLPVLFVWLCLSLWHMASRRDGRGTQGMKLLLWAVTLAAMAGVMQHHDKAARASANAALQTLMQHHAQHGAYPEDLRAAGWTDANAWHIRYGPPQNSPGPLLYYPAPANPFDKYIYNFSRAEWQLRLD